MCFMCFGCSMRLCVVSCVVTCMGGWLFMMCWLFYMYEVAGVFHVLVTCMRWLVCFMCWLHV